MGREGVEVGCERADVAPAAAAPRTVPTAPAAATGAAGEPADPLLLGLALLAITVAVLSTAVARRQGAGA